MDTRKSSVISTGAEKRDSLAGEQSKPLKILIVEDRPADAELCLVELRRAGIPVTADVVVTREDFQVHLDHSNYDVILADHNLPGWDGMQALADVRNMNQNIPFILVTGSLDEETAVEGIKRGVTDYVLKDRLPRLPFAIRRALKEKELEEERTRAADALRESERMLWTLMSNLPGMACRCRMDDRSTLEFASEGCLELTGYAPAALVHSEVKGYEDLIHPDDRPAIRTEVQEAVREGRPYKLTYRIITANGVHKWVWEQGRGVYGHDMRAPAREGFISDITDRKRVEEERDLLLRDLRERIKEQTTLYRIARLLQDTARPLDEVLREVVAALPDGWQYPEITGARIEVPGGVWQTQNFVRTAWTQEAKFSAPDGSDGSIEIAYLEERPQAAEGPFLAEERNLLNTVASGLAAHLERRSIGERLGESERRYRTLFESAHVGICLVRGNRFLDANSAFLSMFGCTREQLFARSTADFSPLFQPDGTPSAEKSAALVSATSSGEIHQFEWRARRLDGSEFDAEVTLSCLEMGNAPLFQSIVRDVTERKRAAEALTRSEASYRSLIQGAAFGIYRATLSGKFVQVNPALVQMLGYSDENELCARDMADETYVHPSERAQLFEHLQHGRRVDSLEADWNRKDGSHIRVRLTGRALCNESGEIEGAEMMVEDVTTRRSLEKQLFLAQKFEAIGQLAGGIAHDFNNVIGAILGWAELGLLETPEGAATRNHLQKIVDQANRAAALTKQLLAFSRRQILAPRNISINQVVADGLNMAGRVLFEDIEIKTIFAPDLSTVRADPTQIDQVLMNLYVNARDAMPNGGQLILETCNVEFDEEYCRAQPFARPGKYVQLAISDTGTGMDSATVEHIFEPFFTTKEVGKGTGLGLATVYGIVKQHGGFIHVYSEPGAGTTFRIYFPVSAGEAERIVPPRAEPVRGGGETILLAEDHEGLREMARVTLSKLGYEVVLATDGEEAVRLFAEHRERICLVVLDVVLPRLRGPEVYARISESKAGMPVLFCSGYSAEASFISSMLDRGAPLLQKPYTPQALAQKVREILDKQSHSAHARSS